MKDAKRTEQAARRVRASASVIHETVRLEGEEQLRRPASALAWSGLAAGLSMGLSFVAEAVMQASLPDAVWRPLLSSLGYSVGFLIVVLGRQQLFTENTLTPILPLLHDRRLWTLGRVLRLWAIVLTANLLGTLLFAWGLSETAIFPPEVRRASAEIGKTALEADFGTTLIRGVFAGWLIALMVWLLPASEGAARPLIIIILTWLVSLAGFAHVIAGSTEVLFVVLSRSVFWGTYVGGFLAPALLGNCIGGVLLVTLLGHAQVADEIEGES